MGGAELMPPAPQVMPQDSKRKPRLTYIMDVLISSENGSILQIACMKKGCVAL